MVRTYKKKRSKPEIIEEDMSAAIRAVKEENMSIRGAAAAYGIGHTALYYRHKKYNLEENKRDYSSKYAAKQVFTMQQEKLLEVYILKCSKISYGLTYTDIRKLAYSYAKLLKCTYPENWLRSEMAGLDWLQSFMRRHEQLTLRKPENTSLARATSFNKTNVCQFFDNYERALQLYPFTPQKVFNLDETGITTVVQAPNVVAKKGTKQVGQVVSAERGQLVTMCAIVQATGNTISPVFVFPRAKFHDQMLRGGPPGAIGLANSPKSGWMTASLFIKVLEHIQNHTKCSKEDPILILMDNHDSHCSLEAVMYARANGMVLVTFPPHCTHRMQPLDVAVMGPFKSKYSLAQNDWHLSNPGKTLTIHDLAELANTAFVNSLTIKNITSGFAKTGTWPISRNAFSDEDFEAACVTDRPLDQVAQTQQIAQNLNKKSTQEPITTLEEPQAGPSNAVTQINFCRITMTSLKALDDISLPSSSNKNLQTDLLTNKNNIALTPEIVRPLPKAAPRKGNLKKNTRKRKSRILTETPEKNNIEQETLLRLAKKKKPSLNWRGENMEDQAIKTKIIPKKKEETCLESDSDEDDNYSVHDESDDSEEFPEEIITDKGVEKNPTQLEEKDYILVSFVRKNVKHFVAQVISRLEENEYKVNYLKRALGKREDIFKFSMPENPECSDVNIKDIILKLPKPIIHGGTARTMSLMSFGIDFAPYNVS